MIFVTSEWSRVITGAAVFAGANNPTQNKYSEPTTVEAGVPGSEYTFWVGMIVSSQTPPAIVRRLHDEAVKALASPEVKERFTQLGAEPLPMTPEAFNAYIRTEMDSAARVAKAAKLQVQ